MGEPTRLVSAIALLLIGIWHPYVVSVTPEMASAIGATAAVFAALVAVGA